MKCAVMAATACRFFLRLHLGLQLLAATPIPIVAQMKSAVMVNVCRNVLRASVLGFERPSLLQAFV